MRLTTIQQNGHRKGPIPNGSDAYHAGRSAMEVCMLGFQKTDGIYYIKPTVNNAAQQVYCDMTTDGGGWMLIARTDPRTTAGNVPWGWLAQSTGGISDFSRAYGLGWVNWHNAGARFTEYIYGNRKNINNNAWGPFVYKRSKLSNAISGGYDAFMVATGVSFGLITTVLKSDLSIFNYAFQPSMQWLQGYAQDISYNNFFMRDVNGNSNLGYGLHSDGMHTTYVNNTDPAINGGNGWQLAGPWGINGTYNSTTGDFDQASGNPQYGGTSQAMIMVRNSAAGY